MYQNLIAKNSARQEIKKKNFGSLGENSGCDTKKNVKKGLFVE